MKELQTKYRRYLLYLANRLAYDEEDRKDLYNEGLIGLWEAEQNYDETKGTFHSFAIMRMKGRMMRWMTNNSRTIRIPANQQNENRRTVDVLISTISIETPIGEDGTIEDLLGNEDEQFNLGNDDNYELIISHLKNYLLEMKEDYQKIILMRYTQDMTFIEIAKEFNQSPQAIKDKHNIILKKLREKLINK